MNELDPDHRLDILQDSSAYVRHPLFPVSKVPSFYEVVGADAAADYAAVREDLASQELDRYLRARTARRLGRSSLDIKE